MDKEHTALERLRQAAELSEFYYQRPLLLAYSGGKDSEVCLELAKRAGVRFEVIHSLTTADAPETVRHIRRKFHELELAGISCEVISPTYKGRPASMWSLIPQKLLPPIRTLRYCCSVLKETSGARRVVVIGLRAEESAARKKCAVAEKPGSKQQDRIRFDFDNGDSRIVAPCRQKAKIMIHPIVDWSNGDVWAYLRDCKTEVNPVYSMGFSRCGCIGCPMAGPSRYTEFRAWPAFEKLYRHAFRRMLDAREARGKPSRWKSADEVFRWWMEDENLDGQLDIFGGEVGLSDER